MKNDLKDTAELLFRITQKLTRDERNAIMGVIRSYREEAEYYRKKLEETEKAR